MAIIDHSDSLRKQDWEVRNCNLTDAKSFIATYHYSKGCSHTGVYFHGLFKLGRCELLGVAQWLPPTKPAAKSVSPFYWKRVLSLSRLAVHPDYPKNAATFLMASSIRIIRGEGKWFNLVTYADESQGHEGKIYLATNWTHVESDTRTPRWIEPTSGKQVAILSTKSRTKQQMVDLGYECVGKFGKRKFTMDLVTVSAKTDDLRSIDIARLA